MNKISANAPGSSLRGRAILLRAILGTVSIFPAAVVAKNKTDQRAEARALIQKALDISDFRASGSPAFELRGTITVPLKKGENATGTYFLDWVSPDRWREEIHVANYSRIRVGGTGKYWQQRSIDYELIPFSDLSGSLEYTRELRQSLADPGWTADRRTKISLDSKRVNKQDVNCVRIGKRFDVQIFCFDSQSGSLIQSGSQYGGDTNSYSDFATLGGKILPGKIEIRDSGKLIVSLKLNGVALLGTVAAGMFDPPQNADVWPTCDDPVPPKVLREKLPDFSRFVVGGTVTYYVVVGTDGLVHNPKILAASSPRDGEAVLRSLKEGKYEPQACHGVPQPVEIMMTTAFSNP